MFSKHSMSKTRDGAAKKDSNTLDFGPPLSTQSGTSVPKDSSITLWGPGVNVHESTPSSILSQSLHVWRKDNAQLPAEQAAEQLNKLYENLPPEALELTFQDMISRNNSSKRKSDGKAAKNKRSPERSIAVIGGVAEDLEEVKRASKVEKANDAKVSLAARISTMLSPKTKYPPSHKKTLSHEELDKLVEKRRRNSTSSDREGLYSASSTPATSFRRVSPLASPKLSPTPSFTDYMLTIDSRSFEKELVKSARFLESYLDDGGMPPVHEGSPQQFELPQSPKCTTARKDENDCSTCSRTNLFFLKTNCLVCGKSFCPSCKNTQTREVMGRLRCKNNCAGTEDGIIEEREENKRRAGCCPIARIPCMRG